MRQFVDEHFNVLVLVTLFLCAGGVLLHVVHHTQDQATLNWLEHVSDQILAALLGMMTGYRLAQAANGKPPTNGTPPTPPEAPNGRHE